MIGKVGQTQSNFIENAHQRNTTKNTTSPTTKTDEFIRSSGKGDLWGYSMKEVKSPLVRSYTAFSSISAPDWSRIPTKGGRTLSNEEMLEQIKSVAQREAMMRYSNNYEQSDRIERMKDYLSIQYISDVSPDRKALYKQAEKELPKAKEEQPTYPINFTLVDILSGLDEVKGFNSKYGNITTAYTTGYGEEYELNIGGQRVMGTSRGIWRYYPTPLEEMKREEFCKIYNMEMEHSKRILEKQ